MENTDGNTSTEETDDTDGSPAEVEADSSCLQIESLTAGTGIGMPAPQDVWLTTTKVAKMPNTGKEDALAKAY